VCTCQEAAASTTRGVHVRADAAVGEDDEFGVRVAQDVHLFSWLGSDSALQ
jgi:hypothetical protein